MEKKTSRVFILDYNGNIDIETKTNRNAGGKGSGGVKIPARLQNRKRAGASESALGLLRELPDPTAFIPPLIPWLLSARRDTLFFNLGSWHGSSFCHRYFRIRTAMPPLLRRKFLDLGKALLFARYFRIQTVMPRSNWKSFFSQMIQLRLNFQRTFRSRWAHD